MDNKGSQNIVILVLNSIPESYSNCGHFETPLIHQHTKMILIQNYLNQTGGYRILLLRKITLNNTQTSQVK